MNTTEKKLRHQVRNRIILFMIFLILSGITAFPLQSELNFLAAHSSIMPDNLRMWIFKMNHEVAMVNTAYPQLSYGTDWLAFSHIVIATAFIGVLQDPLRNRWVVDFGIIACLMVFPLALICGPIREIPFFWRLVDCSFGLFGLLPLLSAKQKIRSLESLTQSQQL